MIRDQTVFTMSRLRRGLMEQSGICDGSLYEKAASFVKKWFLQKITVASLVGGLNEQATSTPPVRPHEGS